MIEVKHVSRVFGDFRAVDDISFSIKTGEIVGLLGPNGAGKTTTMRMITGYLEPTSGTVEVDGLDVVKNPVETKGRCMRAFRSDAQKHRGPFTRK